MSVELEPTSMGSSSSSKLTEALKNLKKSPAALMIMFSPARNPSLFLLKKMSLIVSPTKDGLGLLSRSPVVLSSQLTSS